MKVSLLVVGRLKEPFLVAAEEEYRKRLRPYCTYSVVEHKDEAALLAALPAAASLYAFDERGASMSSAAFSADILGVAVERDHLVGLAALEQLAMEARLCQQASLHHQRAQVALSFALRPMHGSVHPHGEPFTEDDPRDDAFWRSHRAHYINASAQPPSQATLIRTHGSANK